MSRDNCLENGMNAKPTLISRFFMPLYTLVMAPNLSLNMVGMSPLQRDQGYFAYNEPWFLAMWNTLNTPP